jgi:DNA-binding protein HU-beta
MRKTELVRELAEDFGIPRRQVDELVTAMLDKITDVLKSGDKVQLTPFGQFKVRDRAARMGRNPMTGEPVKIPAKRVLRFLAGRALKEAVGTAKRRPGGAKAKKTGPARKAASRKAPARKAKRR